MPRTTALDMNFSPDRWQDIDASLTERLQVAKELGRAVPVRVSVGLYDQRKQQWGGWRGLIWRGEIQTLQEGRQFRNLLTAFFELLGKLGPSTVLAELKAIDERHRPRKHAVTSDLLTEP